MFAIGSCSLPATGNGLSESLMAAALLATGIGLMLVVRKSPSRMSVLLPMLLLGGVSLPTPGNTCQESTGTTIATTLTTPSTTATVAPVGTSTSSTTTSTAPATTLPRTCAQGGTCVVGNTGPGGGKIFYTSSTPFTEADSQCNSSCRYLEVAPDGWNGGVDPSRTWSEGNTNWNTRLLTPTFLTVGSGYANTLAIIAQGNADPAVSAAALTRSYNGGGLTDWFLPSNDELNELYNARTFAGTFTPNDYYWSSSEQPDNGGWALRFQPFDIDCISKQGPFFVRPIRAL